MTGTTKKKRTPPKPTKLGSIKKESRKHISQWIREYNACVPKEKKLKVIKRG